MRLHWRCIVAAFVLVHGPAAASPTDHASIVRSVSGARIRVVLGELASLGPRLAGSQGEHRALDLVEQSLRALGATRIVRRAFPVTVPDPDATGVLRIVGRDIEVLPMWPNLVRTSTCRVQGPLVYAGRGEVAEMDGLPIRGSIALMEFDSGGNWRNAARLGAAAVVFLQPRQGSRAEAEAKFGSIPVSVPRFYLRSRDAGPVLAAAFKMRRADLACRQEWVVRQSGRVVADFEGADERARGERIVLWANADAMCVVPKLAHGGEEAASLAAMLQIVRSARLGHHRRPMRVIVSGSHGTALLGARSYVDERLETDREPLLLAMTLDLSSGSPTLGAFGRGWFYYYRDESQVPLQSIARTFRWQAETLVPLLKAQEARLVLADAVNNADARDWRNTIPARFAFDCEPFVNAGYPALTLATVDDARSRVDTPFNTVDQVLIPNVVRQAQVLAVLLHHVLNDPAVRGGQSIDAVPLVPARPRRMSLIGGFATVQGRVTTFDPNRHFVPNEPVPNSLAIVSGYLRTFMGVRGSDIQKTSPDGAYRMIGVPPKTSHPVNSEPMVVVSAFGLGPNGEIRYAPDQGMLGSGEYPTVYSLKTSYKSSPIVLFPALALDFFDLIDPQDLIPLASARVLDAATDTDPLNFGFEFPYFPGRDTTDREDSAVLFLPKGKRFKLLMGSDSESARLLLANAARGDESGRGYSIEEEAASGAGRFEDVALRTAEDLYTLNQSRLDRFREHRIISAGMASLQARARQEIEAARDALAARRWADADRHARAGWGYALRAHPTIQTTANDVVNGVVFYLFLLIPFSYFLERLLIGARSLSVQLAWSAAIFVASFVVLRLAHPAFEIVTNPSMIFVGFVMAALSLIVITFILGKFESSLRSLKRLQSGLHEVDINRVSVGLAAFNLGVGNMRRRKARTFLTTLTLVVMTFIVLSFTSIVDEFRLSEQPSSTRPRYRGILIRSPGMEALQESTHRLVASEIGRSGTVARRAYFYGAQQSDSNIVRATRASRVADLRALLGMEAAEALALRPQEALLAGRWFHPGERDAAILPQPVADALGIQRTEVGSAQIELGGNPIRVVGIIDTGALRALTDLDGDAALPPDFSLSRRYQSESGTATQAFRSFVRLDPEVVIVLPTQTVLDFGGDLRSLAVSFEDATEARRRLESLMPRLRLNLYASVQRADGAGLEVRQFSVLSGARSAGFWLVAVQMLIAAVFVLNTMIATVYERTREIAIFSAVGLAPNHIALLFFAESLVYGVLGAVFGYFGAQLAAKAIVATGSLPGLYLNFSSTSAVFSAATVMGVVLLSTVYPARRASQIAAPALAEEVTDSAPEGDRWEVRLPFSVAGAEAAPLAAFLAEWLAAHEEYSIGSFVAQGSSLERQGGQLVITCRVWLAPYDLGVSQQIAIVAAPGPQPDVYSMTLTAARTGGEPENWMILNRRFLSALRRQFLTWRTLDATQRGRYQPAPLAP